MSSQSNLPRVTYSNVSADFTPVHDMLDTAIPAFKANLGGTTPNYIDGADDNNGEPYEIVSPADSDLSLGSFITGTQDSVDRAVAAARKAYPAWSGMPWDERLTVMRRAAETLAARKYDLGIASVLEVGKSRLEGVGEAEEAVDLINYYCDETERNKGYTVAMKGATPAEETRSVMRPYGVFAVISPFNFPVALSTNMMSAALIGGNTVVFHPTTNGALTGTIIIDAFKEAGLPAGVVNIVNGSGVGPKLVDAPGIDGIAFTGSYDVGMGIHRKMAASPFGRPLVAEMGGKNPAYVSEFADPDMAAEGVMRSAYGLTGEKCSACSSAYVHASVYDAFMDKLVEMTGKLKVGNPEEKDVFMGPIVNQAAYDIFAKAVEESRADGRVAFGGNRLSGGIFDRGYYIEPTIVDGLPADHRLFKDELFAPFVAVARYEGDLASAIARGNDVVYGLTAGVYSSRPEDVDLFFTTAEAGVLYANRRTNATAGAWPGYQSFGGWKGSGLSGKSGLGPHYPPLFMREQSHTLIKLD